ncbi:MAG: hypothetical protein LBE61_07360 [Burkholderiaceae bacterium]|jgi:hypothetical protein|nr:hypothetical protein [Burkholderiaceae bacterium]
MLPDKIAKSHLLKLHRMQDDMSRACRDLEALRLAYLRIAAEFLSVPGMHTGSDADADTDVPGQRQANRCVEIIAAHAVLRADIEQALLVGISGKQVVALQVHLDALEDERDTLDADLRSAQRQLAMRRPITLEAP